MRENAGGNGAYQVLPGMIWDSACPLERVHEQDSVRSKGIEKDLIGP